MAFAGSWLYAEDFFELRRDGAGMLLELEHDPSRYFLLEGSVDLLEFTPETMGLGSDAPIWEIPFAGRGRGFYRILPLNVFAPRDSDGDGIDDVYELVNSDILDPLNPLDAHLDPDGNGLTHLDEYRMRFALDDEPPQYHSNETTLFNFGAPTARLEGISKELTMFNFWAPSGVLAVSKEVSLYNGQTVPSSEFLVQVSREVSLWNYGVPSAEGEAISRVVSIYNGGSVPQSEFLVQHSRELSFFNHGAPTAPVEAISREVTIFNFIETQDP